MNGVTPPDKSITLHALKLPWEINAARALLHEIFILEQQWEINPGNPTGMRVLWLGGEQLLADQYDQVSDWFGAFHRDELIGVIRLHGPIDGMHEMEHLIPLPDYLRGEHCRQISRLAIRPEYRHRLPIIYQLVEALLRRSLELQAHYLFNVSTYPIPGKIYEKFGMTRLATSHCLPGSSEANYIFSVDQDNMKRALEQCRDAISRINNRTKREVLA